METNPDLGDIDVSERPKNHTTKGQIVQVLKGTQAELYELEEDEEPQYGDREDERLRLEIETDVEGDSFTVVEDISFYENPSDRSKLGKFVNRYGTPEPGIEVTIDFDEEGEASIVL